MGLKKFTVVKPVLVGGKIQSKGAKVELDADSASTKSLLATEHVTEGKAPKAGEEEKK